MNEHVTRLSEIMRQLEARLATADRAHGTTINVALCHLQYAIDLLDQLDAGEA
jgi:hypothetical protein